MVSERSHVLVAEVLRVGTDGIEHNIMWSEKIYCVCHFLSII